MTRGLFLLAVLFPFSVLAQPAPEKLSDDGSIKGYRFGACDQWDRVESQFGGSAYGCSFFPQRIVVADGYDVVDALNAADKKVAALEARIAELEKKVGGTPPTP